VNHRAHARSALCYARTTRVRAPTGTAAMARRNPWQT